LRVFAGVLFVKAILFFVSCAANFPYSTDVPPTSAELAAARKYYTDIYMKPAGDSQPTETAYGRKYEELAKAAKGFKILERFPEFIERFNLVDKRVLELGSGRGYLQDLAKDYAGLDISPSSVSRFYHTKFVVGTATALPFPDNSFDGAWSIWVF